MALSIEQFPLISADPKAVKTLERVLNVLNPALEAGTIPNPRFQDAKFYINHLADELFFINGLYYNDITSHNDLWFTTGNAVNGKLKAAVGILARHKDWAELGLENFIAAATEYKTVYDALQSLKNSVVKRQGRSEEEKAADYVPPIPSTESAATVNAILKEMTDPLTVQYENNLYNWFVIEVDRRFATPRVHGEKYIPGLADMLMRSVGENWDSVNSNYTSLKPDYKTILRNKAHSDADFAQRMFLYKNVMKLANILEKKNNFSSYSIINGSIDSHGYSGEIQFRFADGAWFIVRNKVVSKYSCKGKRFLQYPTTFHTAHLAGGVSMKGASEKRMIEEFTK